MRHNRPARHLLRAVSKHLEIVYVKTSLLVSRKTTPNCAKMRLSLAMTSKAVLIRPYDSLKFFSFPKTIL